MTTRHFAIVGDPVAHSASPRMHAAAYVARGLDCTYEAIHATLVDLPGVVARLKSDELSGLNVTIPHKRRILAYADAIDAGAETVAAANTLVRMADGRIVAHNTDVPAIADELRELATPLSKNAWREAHALVLRTGATSRSAIVALAAHLGVAAITVRGRALADPKTREAFRLEVSEILRRAISGTVLHLEPWSPSPETDRSVAAIVQTTNLGMDGADSGDLAVRAVAWNAVHRDAVALDVVYGRGKTPFVLAAEARGLRAAGGQGMLARQGALAFELWLGAPAPLEAMRAAISA